MMGHGVGPPLPQCYVQRLERNFGAAVIGYRPADDPPTEGIDDDRQVQEASPGRHVRDVGHSELVRRIGFE
jgi:hypothetical protein